MAGKTGEADSASQRCRIEMSRRRHEPGAAGFQMERPRAIDRDKGFAVDQAKPLLSGEERHAGARVEFDIDTGERP